MRAFLTILAFLLFGGSLFCASGVVMNASFAVSNPGQAEGHRVAVSIFFVLTVASFLGSLALGVAVFRLRRRSDGSDYHS